MEIIRRVFLGLIFCLSGLTGLWAQAANIELRNYATDSAALSALNKQFIENFVRQDVKRHEQILCRDFVCIESDGHIVGREEYLKGWATAYQGSGYTSFGYVDEVIRIFGNTALVRSKTVYTKRLEGKEVRGNSVYTDTYVKENGVWRCVQAQITPVR